MDRILNVIDSIIRYVSNGASLLFLPMTLIAVYEVMMRYLFNSPTIWAWDVNVQLFCLIVALGAGDTLLKHGHVIMDILIVRFPDRLRLFINSAVYLVFLFSAGIIIWQCGDFAWRSIQLQEKASTFFGPPVYPLKAVLFIGVILLGLAGTSIFLRNTKLIVKSKSEN